MVGQPGNDDMCGVLDQPLLPSALEAALVAEGGLSRGACIREVPAVGLYEQRTVWGTKPAVDDKNDPTAHLHPCASFLLILTFPSTVSASSFMGSRLVLLIVVRCHEFSLPWPGQVASFCLNTDSVCIDSERRPICT